MESEARKLAEACGVKYILAKPCEPETILAIIAEVLKDRSLPIPRVLYNEVPDDQLLLTTRLASRGEMAVSRLTALLELSQRLMQALDVQSLLRELCNGARQILGTKYASGMLLGEKDQEGTYFFTSGIDETRQQQQPTPSLHDGVLRALLTHRKCLNVGDLKGDPLARSFPFDKLVSFIGLPLRNSRGVFAILYLTNKIGGALLTRMTLSCCACWPRKRRSRSRLRL